MTAVPDPLINSDGIAERLRRSPARLRSTAGGVCRERPIGRRTLMTGSPFLTRDRQRECGSLARFAAHPDRAAVRFGDGLDDRETESGAAG